MQYQNSVSKYNLMQIKAVRRHMGDLTALEFKALFLRFWGPYSIQDIACDLGVSWDTADELITRAQKKLRGFCLGDPVFQRQENEVSAA